MVQSIGTTSHVAWFVSHVALDRAVSLLRPIKWIHTLACLFRAAEDFTVVEDFTTTWKG